MSGWELVYWIVVASLIVEAIRRPFNYSLSWLWNELIDRRTRYRLRSRRWEIRGGRWVKMSRQRED